MGENFFSVIFYSFYIFEGNYWDFKKTIQSYIELTNTNEFLSNERIHLDLNIHGCRELSRLIHNYAASWLSLVDHTRVIKEKLKGHEVDGIRNFALEYEVKLNEFLKDSFENFFVKDLRRYVQHKAVPIPTLHYRLTQTGMSCSFQFNTKQIEDFDWSKNSKQYIRNNKAVPLEEIIDRHFEMMKDFYLWIQFRDHQLHPYTSDWVKQATFETWKQQSGK